jgi:DNA-binding MarR family transcriptional regulator
MTLESDIKQVKAFKSSSEKTLVNIMYTNNWICDKQHYIMKEFGLTIQQYNVLRILKGQNKSPITINQIIDRMLDKMSNASRLVDKLVQKKYVDRTYREDDRRACNVVITKEGEKVLQKINLKIDDLEMSTNNLTEEEYKTLNFLLDKFRTEPK